jgi:signal transduction histidine kinase
VTVLVEPQAITVADTGPGIAPEEREMVLDRFHRGAAGAGAGGSGLGLSLVATIVHLHGFALTLEDARPGLIARITASQPPVTCEF